MKNIRYLFAINLVILTLNGIQAQEPVTIVFKGSLTSGDGYISNQACNIAFFMLNETGETVLERSLELSTDSLGQFGFFIRDIPAVFDSVTRAQSVKILLSIQPGEGSVQNSWEGTNVEYTLRKIGQTEYSVIRQDDRQMEQSFGPLVWSFWDTVPISNLTGSFYISFNDSLTDPGRVYQLGWDLEQASTPEEEAAPAPQRGLKGGYAVGGYKKQQ